jgi:hypothetical protein
VKAHRAKNGQYYVTAVVDGRKRARFVSAAHVEGGQYTGPAIRWTNAKKASPKKASPRKASPRKASPKKAPAKKRATKRVTRFSASELSHIAQARAGRVKLSQEEIEKIAIHTAALLQTVIQEKPRKPRKPRKSGESKRNTKRHGDDLW